MQLGSLQFERPPDVQIYLPSFELGKSIPNSAEFGLGLSPKNPRPFLKKGRSKTFNPHFASSLCYRFQQLANIYGCILIDNCSLPFAHFFCISRLRKPFHRRQKLCFCVFHLLRQIPSLAKNSALRLSHPGIGEMCTSGTPAAALSVDESPPGFEINTLLAFKYSAILVRAVHRRDLPIFCKFSFHAVKQQPHCCQHKMLRSQFAFAFKYGSSARTALIIAPAPMLPPESSNVRLSFGKLSASRALSFVMVSSEKSSRTGMPSGRNFSAGMPRPVKSLLKSGEGVTYKSQSDSSVNGTQV